jgi:hypothetical protein
LKPRYSLLALILVPVLLSSVPVHAAAIIPKQTDDGWDPINLVFTGYAPAAWVAQNLHGWTTTFCSEPIKTLDGKGYDFNLEAQDQNPPCFGPRYHIRIWDMGTDPVLGHWSVGAVHHEHTECTFIIICQHVIDSWEQAEAFVRSTFANGTAALSISTLALNNTGLYQRVYNDGNATLIRLAPTNLYSVTFQETGLPANTPWSVALNGTENRSTDENITIRSQKALYSFTVSNVPGYVADVSTGNLNLTANKVVPIRFTSIQALDAAANQRGIELFLATTAAAWSIVIATVVFTKYRARRKNT